MLSCLRSFLVASLVIIFSSTIAIAQKNDSPTSNKQIQSNSMQFDVYALASWNNMSSEQKRLTIVSQAKNYIGSYGGQCKTFVQFTVVKPISGIVIPLNYENYYDPFNLAQWYYSSDVIAIYQWRNNQASIAQLALKPGYIIQWRMKDGTPHTMVVEAIGLYTIQVIDSNFGLNGIVQRHWIDLSWINQKIAAGTVYQVR